MSTRHRHLPLEKSAPVNPRRTRPAFPGGGNNQPETHGAQIRDALDDTLTRAVKEPGFDPRRILKLKVEGLQADDLQAVPGLEVVSHEAQTVVVLFASDEGLAEFRQRLDLLSRGGTPKRKEVLFAVKAVDSWGPDDRTGPALRMEGLPDQEPFIVDVELWPLEKGHERRKMLGAFDEWCSSAGAEILDTLNQEAVVLRRVRVSRSTHDRLLEHRDIRMVDLPPRIQLDAAALRVSLDELADVPAPPASAPGVVVLDSGIVSNHPLLQAAVGDAQTFIPGSDAADNNGHGTRVAGLALYGDIADCLDRRAFVPVLRLFSGRITDGDACNDTGFVENHIAEAVEYFVSTYQAKVFNLSFGDLRKPYLGGHVRGLAATLDTLARTREILFVVSTGNFPGGGDEDPAIRWRSHYPNYLLQRDGAALLDPAPAVNVVTVGAVARYEKSRQAGRYPWDPAYQAVARTGQPSPFTRSGPGPGGSIKPELVEYGGNWAVDVRAGEHLLQNALLGEPTLAHDFAATGNLMVDDYGTSMAAPKVAHLAARILAQYPNASINLVRALLVAHACIPEGSLNLTLEPGDLTRLVGYGRPDAERSLHSLDGCVSLVAEEVIGEDQHHFFEVPVPEDFLKPWRRDRVIKVALAHMPLVRTTRIDYRASKLEFRLLRAGGLDEVVRVFNRTPKDNREELIKELASPTFSSTARKPGTVQAASYPIKQIDKRHRDKALFVVVTRTVPQWARDRVPNEKYALVVALEDRSDVQVRYYQQIVELRQRQRVRQRR